MFSFSKQNDGNNGMNLFSNTSNSSLFGAPQPMVFTPSTTTITTTNSISTTPPSNTNNNNNNSDKSKNKKFCNFKLSPINNQLLLFKPNEKNNNIRYEENDTLSVTTKFYNDLYNHFEVMQRISNTQNLDDERVREISHISKTYLSVIISHIKEMEESIKNGSYIDDEDQCVNCDPLDKMLIEENRERVENILKQTPKNSTLVIFCGNSDSIYPLLCSEISNKLSINCILIVRESNQSNQQKNEILETIRKQTKLHCLTKEEYSDRENYILNLNLVGEFVTTEIHDIYEKYIGEIEKLNLISSVWKVANLFHFNQTPMIISSTQLLDCIENERKGLVDTYEDIINKKIDTTDPRCFEHMAKLLVCGCVDQVISILALMNKMPRSASQISSSSRKSPINMLIEILSSIPLRKQQQQQQYYSNPNEILIQWTKWNTETKSLLNQYINSGSSTMTTTTSINKNQIDDNLLPIIKILLGDQSVIRSNCNSYLQLVISNLLYVEYITSVTQLRQLFAQCYDIITTPSKIDRVYMALANRDKVTIAISKITKYFPSWVSAHLVDLLYHHPYVLRQSLNEKSGLSKYRDTLVMEHGEKLASNSTLLIVGCGYLKYVENGQAMINEYISRQPIDYEKNTLKLLNNIAITKETKNSIYRMLSIRDFQRQRYASSLSWLMLANDSSRITQLSNYLLENQLNSDFLNDLQSILEKNQQQQFTIDENNSFNNNNINNNEYFDISSNTELIFLIKYRELINLWKERSFKEYSNQLCQMFKDKIIPKRFWIRLLLDCVPLFESNKNVYFNYQDTLLLQSCLEEILQSHLLDEYSQSISNQDIQIIRASLSRNLAKSIMINIEFDALDCSLLKPCDINEPSSWLNDGELPGPDDDVLIDYSTSIIKEVYIFGKGLNITYKSLTIKGDTNGDDKSHPHLTLTDCNLNISKSFTIVRSTVYINQTTKSNAISSNIDINNKFKLINSSSLYIYNNNIMTINGSISVDKKSKINFYNTSKLQCNGNNGNNIEFFNTPAFHDQSILITYKDKLNNNSKVIFGNGLLSNGSIVLGKTIFRNGLINVNNILINDEIELDSSVQFIVNGKLTNSISPSSLSNLFIINKNSSLSIKSNLSNQLLSNIKLENGEIIINNPTIGISKISGIGNIKFDTTSNDNELNNTITQINSNDINIGLSGNSKIILKSIQIGNLFDFKSILNSSNENIPLVYIKNQCTINGFKLIYSKLTIDSPLDKLTISNITNSSNNLIEGTILNNGELNIFNSILNSSIDSTGTTTIDNSIINGDIFIFGNKGEFKYLNNCSINGFLQFNDNSTTLINYNEINNKLQINGDLILNSPSFAIFANQIYQSPLLLNNTLFINGGTIQINDQSKNKINLYFTKIPSINQPYQLFKLSNQHQIQISLPSIINIKLISDSGNYNILNLNSQFYINQTNNIAFTQFSNPPIVKHLNGFEIFLIIFSCIAIVVLIACSIFLYLKHKRYIGYLPL